MKRILAGCSISNDDGRFMLVTTRSINDKCNLLHALQQLSSARYYCRSLPVAASLRLTRNTGVRFFTTQNVHTTLQKAALQVFINKCLWRIVNIHWLNSISNQCRRKPEATPPSERQPMRPQIFHQFSDDLFQSSSSKTILFRPHTPANSSLWAPSPSPF